jgi:hypothetical protein
MNIERYNKKILKDYLLSKLSETETEKFDELSITDDDFGLELKSVEDDLVDSYISGELDKPDLEKFEMNYLASHLRREKVEFARALQIVGEKNSVKTSKVAKEETSRSGFAFWNIFANFNTAMRFGFAALLLAFVGFFGWLLLGKTNKSIEQVKVENTPTPQTTIQPTQIPNTNQITPIPTALPKTANIEKTPEPKVSPTQQPTVEPTKQPTPNLPTLATFVLLPPTRGGNSLQSVSIPKQTTDVAFGLPLETDDFKSYRVFLKNQAGKILWQSGKLTSKKSSLNVRFPAKLLQTSIYSLAVVGIGEENEPENIGNYSFRSVIK